MRSPRKVLPPPVQAYQNMGDAAGTILEALETGSPVSLVSFHRATLSFLQCSHQLSQFQHAMVTQNPLAHTRQGQVTQISALTGLMALRLGLGVGRARLLGVNAGLTYVGPALSGRATPDSFLSSVTALAESCSPSISLALRTIIGAELATDDCRRQGHPATRIAAVAEDFIRRTGSLPHGEEKRPDQAVREIAGLPEGLDPVACRLLVLTLGVYPVGTKVSLSTGQSALVFSVPSDPEKLESPGVLVLLPEGKTTPLDLILGETRIVRVEGEKGSLDMGDFMFS